MNIFEGLINPCRSFAPRKDRHLYHPDILKVTRDWAYVKDIAFAIGRTVNYASVTLRTMAEQGQVEVRKAKVPWAKPLVNQYRRVK